MYGKLFASMYDGSLYGNWKALVTFQQMIVLCNRDGILDMTPHALAARTGIPLEIINDGIAVLESPDPYSRTQGVDGRRIERIDEHRPWGWSIVNYSKYRNMVRADEKRAADRLRLAEKRQMERHVAENSSMSQSVAENSSMSQSVAENSSMSQSVADVAQAEVEAEAEVEVEVESQNTLPGKPGVLPTSPANSRHVNGTEPPGFHAFWDLWPSHKRKADREKCVRKWRVDNCEPIADAILAKLELWKRSDEWAKDNGTFVPAPLVWLNKKIYEAGDPESTGPPPGQGVVFKDENGNLQRSKFVC